MPDFTAPIEPAVVDEQRGTSEDPASVDSNAATTAVVRSIELKPKSLWDSPTFVALRTVGNSGAETPSAAQAMLHPLKTRYCRFSLMQRYKQLKSPKKPLSQYCPNDLLLQHNVRRALTALTAVPDNNLRLLGPWGTTSSDLVTLSPLHLWLVEQLWKSSDLCKRIAALQRQNTVDIQLLAAWNRMGTTANVELLRCSRQAGAVGNSACHCQADVVTPCSSAEEALWVRPSTIDESDSERCLDDAVGAFYTATTARDLSVIVTLEYASILEQFWSSDGATVDVTEPFHEIATRFADGFCARMDCAVRVDETQVVSLCVFGRMAVVDIDCKRHKSLEHYEQQDAEICRVAAVAMC